MKVYKSAIALTLFIFIVTPPVCAAPGDIDISGRYATFSGKIRADQGFAFNDGTSQGTAATSGAGGSGTQNYLAKWTAATTLGNSVLYDNGTNVGVGITNPGVKLDVAGSIRAYTGGATGWIGLSNGTGSAPGYAEWYRADGTTRVAYLGWSGGGATNLGLNLENSASFNINGGNVGIGIGASAPGQALSVAGVIESTTGGFKFPDGTTQTTAVSGAGVPSGAVMFFNLASCPSGWTELTGARGRYIVGLPASGTLAGTAGTALSDLENRATGQHNHTITDPGHNHGLLRDWGNDCTSCYNQNRIRTDGSQSSSTQTSTTGITINNAGSVAGTNSPYIQLLICQKD